MNTNQFNRIYGLFHLDDGTTENSYVFDPVSASREDFLAHAKRVFLANAFNAPEPEEFLAVFNAVFSKLNDKFTPITLEEFREDSNQ
jgi:hypothetical protein